MLLENQLSTIYYLIPVLYKLTHSKYKRLFNRHSRKSGLAEASKQLLYSVKIFPTYQGPEPSKRSTLFVVNHASQLDMFLILAIIPKGTKLITVSFNPFSRKFQSITLPVYLSQQKGGNIAHKLLKLYWKRQEKNITFERASKLNHTAINKSVRALNRGQNVVIFPQGAGFAKKREWKRGIGYICSQVKKSTKIQFVHITGNKPRHLYRLAIPFLTKLYSKPAHPLVTFYDPIPLKEFNTTRSPKAITHQIERRYNKLTKTTQK